MTVAVLLLVGSWRALPEQYLDEMWSIVLAAWPLNFFAEEKMFVQVGIPL